MYTWDVWYLKDGSKSSVASGSSFECYRPPTASIIGPPSIEKNKTATLTTSATNVFGCNIEILKPVETETTCKDDQRESTVEVIESDESTYAIDTHQTNVVPAQDTNYRLNCRARGAADIFLCLKVKVETVTKPTSCYPTTNKKGKTKFANVGENVIWKVEPASDLYSWSGTDISSSVGGSLLKKYETIGQKDVSVSAGGTTIKCGFDSSSNGITIINNPNFKPI
jgi:hypothetical protein